MASRHDRTRRLAAARRQRVQHSITPRGHRSSHAVLQREDALDCTSPASRRQAGSAKESYELLESETILISLRCRKFSPAGLHITYQNLKGDINEKVVQAFCVVARYGAVAVVGIDRGRHRRQATAKRE